MHYLCFSWWSVHFDLACTFHRSTEFADRSIIRNGTATIVQILFDIFGLNKLYDSSHCCRLTLYTSTFLTLRAAKLETWHTVFLFRLLELREILCYEIPSYTPSITSEIHILILIYLLTAIGLSLGGSSTVHIYTQTIHRTIQNKQYIEQHNNFGWVRAVPRLG